MFGRRDIRPLDGWAFTRSVERLLLHLGFEDVFNIDGAGDLGGDLIAERNGERWVFQCKSQQSTAVNETAVHEVQKALVSYNANRAAVVANGSFTQGAGQTVSAFERITGVKIGLWSREAIEALWADAENCKLMLGCPALRPYQADAFAAIRHDLSAKSRAFLVLATGLGKTMVAGTVIEWFLREHPEAEILVAAQSRDLVDQLERAMWRHVSKFVPTQQLTGDEKPDYLSGITCATIQSAIVNLRHGWRPGLIFIDEAHHVGEVGQFAELIRLCESSQILGVTATPWRGDAASIEAQFGGTTFRLGIEEGMRLGYLCDVKYRLFLDDVDWDFVRRASRQNYSVRELNTRLFLPQRDEKIRDELLSVWSQTRSPRAIVFCQSIEHAKRMHRVLAAVPSWRNSQVIHAEVARRERQVHLMDFRRGTVPLLVAVDVLNEGVDVPDVNIVCFARVTHSRRVFVQQLGRGLRLSPIKEFVSVLDFVSDLRRVAAALHLRRAIQGEADEVFLPSSHSITFEDKKVESLMVEWLLDAADVELAAEDVRLDFPDFAV